MTEANAAITPAGPLTAPCIGIDLGGTKIEGVLIGASGQEIVRRRFPSPQHDYAASVAGVAGLVRTLEAAGGMTDVPVGLGIPGSISRKTGLVHNANSTWLNGQPLQRDLASALARAVPIANDANCFALSEARDGAGANAQSVFGVILGTGTGGGLINRGHLIDGQLGIGGEWGHNPLPWMTPQEFPGPRCYCGRNGCIERFVSGPALAADHERATGQRLAPASIAERAAAGDAECSRSLERLEDRLARALAHVVNLIDPDVFVLGGGVSNIERLHANVPRLWGAYTYAPPLATRLVRAAHGDASGVRGAARLWDA